MQVLGTSSCMCVIILEKLSFRVDNDILLLGKYLLYLLGTSICVCLSLFLLAQVLLTWQYISTATLAVTSGVLLSRL